LQRDYYYVWILRGDQSIKTYNWDPKPGREAAVERQESGADSRGGCLDRPEIASRERESLKEEEAGRRRRNH